MQVRIALVAPLKAVDNEIDLDLPEGSCLKDAVDRLMQVHGRHYADCVYQSDGVTPYVYFWVNGSQASLETVLKEGQEIVIMPPIGGG